jgi:transposase InsO family protein
LVRLGLNRLAWLDRPTGRVIRRYERGVPGELVHVDVKKLGRLRAGGGWRVLGRAAAPSTTRTKKLRTGWAFVHSAVDDHSRLAYSEVLEDERKDTCAAFWCRAEAWFLTHGVAVQEVMTDNAMAYRSIPFSEALGTIKHRFTRPYRPQTNGKVERFNRTLLEEWAYVRPYISDAERNDALVGWLHIYNHHRCHTALHGEPRQRPTGSLQLAAWPTNRRVQACARW